MRGAKSDEDIRQERGLGGRSVSNLVEQGCVIYVMLERTLGVVVSLHRAVPACSIIVAKMGKLEGFG